MKKNTYLLFFFCGIFILLLCFSCTSKMGSNHPGEVPGYSSNRLTSNWDTAVWSNFHLQAVAESLEPIRPGNPGVSPFWNGHARRFINVPSFDFSAINNAIKYRYTSISGANTRPYTFETENPWSLLTPVWEDLPVGLVYLKVEGLDKDNNPVGIAGERIFYKAARAEPAGMLVFSR